MKVLSFKRLWPGFGLVLILVAVPALAQGNSPVRPPLPNLHLTHGLRGDAAVQALGGQFEVVAAHYGKSTNELWAIFRRDNSLRLDERGHLFYACDGLAVPQNAGGDPNSVPPLAEIAPLSQTFLLHSRPGATKLIYLDFDGYTLSSNAWTVNDNGGTNIVAPSWDTDGNPASFSSGEQTAIQQIWLRVAEDYAPFDVDVTTEFPGEAALTRANNGDSQYGTRALVSAIGSYFGNPGGIAYVGVYDDVGDYYKPALIFPENLANSEKYIAEAISHEVGHNLGLSHDGVTGGTSYYTGQGNWAPIMGVGYYKPISQWSKGEYTNANNTENDLTIITQNGLSYRANDFGTSIGTAKPLAGTTISTNGVIAHTDEADFASFQTGAGTIQISAVVWERGADLHLTVSLYGSGGILLTNVESVDNGSGTHSVSFSSVVTDGTYYVAVAGKGSGDPTTTGYSSYASLGQYTLNLTLPGSGTWLPTPAGNYSWINSANWLSGNIPNAPDVTAKINNAITGSQFIALDDPITIGQLILGTTSSTNAFTIQTGGGGPLTFDVVGGTAGLQKLGSGADEIAADIALLDPLVVSNASLATLKLSGAITGAGSVTKIGAGRLLFAGTNSFTGNLVISNGILALDAASRLGTPQVEIASGAVFDVPGGYRVTAGQTLAGRGVVLGNMTLGTNALLAPGGSGQTGTLTFSNNLTLDAGSKTVMEISKPPLTNDCLLVNGLLSYGGTLTVTNLSGSLAPSDTFQLFNAAAYAGKFATTNLPTLAPGQRWQFTSANGTLAVVQTVATNPVALTLAFTNGALEFSWPADHTGWTLQVQTNSLADGLGTNWISLPTTAATNRFSAPITAMSDAVFYRLVFP